MRDLWRSSRGGRGGTTHRDIVAAQDRGRAKKGKAAAVKGARAAQSPRDNEQGLARFFVKPEQAKPNREE